MREIYAYVPDCNGDEKFEEQSCSEIFVKFVDVLILSGVDDDIDFVLIHHFVGGIVAVVYTRGVIDAS